MAIDGLDGLLIAPIFIFEGAFKWELNQKVNFKKFSALYAPKIAVRF